MEGTKDRVLSSHQKRGVGASELTPWLWCGLALAAMVILNTGVGSVSIRPLTVLRILLGQWEALGIDPTWPSRFETIVLDIRMPNTVLIALTGMALAGSGAAYQGLFTGASVTGRSPGSPR